MAQRRIHIRLFLLSAMCLAQGCSQSSDQSSGSTPSPPSFPASSDFAKSQIVSATSVAADGQTKMTFVVKLMNFDGSLVSNYRPTYGVTPPTGITINPCGYSDATGLATCTLTSIASGPKSVFLTNAKVGLSREVTFTVPLGEQSAIILAGSLSNGTTASGYSVNLSLGGPLNEFNATT